MTLRRICIAIALLGLASISPVPQRIVHPYAKTEFLFVPANSPVTFRGWSEDDGFAHFKGRFVVTGTVVHFCDVECEPPLSDSHFVSAFIPDRAVAARLPNWRSRGGDMTIYLLGDEALTRQMISAKDKAALHSGRITEVRRPVAIEIEDFAAGLECDSPTYTARFVALAKPSRPVLAHKGGLTGCG